MTDKLPAAELPKLVPESKPELSPLAQKLHEALNSKETDLKKVGDLMNETFKTAEYSPEVVLSSIKDIFDQHKAEFKPPKTLESFIKSFGEGMVSLCQQKLVEAGYKLGKFGKNKDGVDGKLGPMTAAAISNYFKKKTGPATSLKPKAEEVPAKEVKIDKPIPQKVEKVSKNPEDKQPKAKILSVDQGDKVNPEEEYIPKSYQPGEKAPKPLSTLAELKDPIEEIYERTPHIYKINTIRNIFGDRNGEKIKKYITTVDPLTNEPISFLGRPLHGGINLMMIPFLKIAEQAIQNMGLNYKPKAKDIGGYHNRDMNSMGGQPSNVPSFHAYGIAIDMDASENSPAKGRGDIPDEVVMEMVKAGFSWGGRGDLTAKYDFLGSDPMHFQMRFPPTDPAGQAIINASSAGRAYWKVIEPMLAEIG